MIRFLTFIILTICFLIFFRTYWIWHLNQMRRRGLYPQDQPTLFHVKELLLKGEKETAVRVYRQIFNTNDADARKAVDELEKSLRGSS